MWNLKLFPGDRFDMDHDDDVLYCYEIQLEECVRRKGLGKYTFILSRLDYLLKIVVRKVHDEGVGADDDEE